MYKLKLTPLMLFLIVIFALVIGVLCINWLPLNMSFSEGFVSFDYHANSPGGNSIVIPQYTNQYPVYQVYDSVFFDQSTGNVIQVFSTPQSGTADMSGTSISKIEIVSPTPQGYTETIVNTQMNNGVVTPTTKVPGPSAAISSNYKSWVFPSNDHYASELYQVIYTPWDMNNILTVWDISASKLVSSTIFGNEFPATYTYTNPPVLPSFNTYVADASNVNYFTNTTGADTLYDPSHNASVYVLSDYVRFDTANGYLIVSTGAVSSSSHTLTVYSNSGTTVTYTNKSNTPNTIPSVTSFSPFAVLDTTGNNIVLYIPIGQKAMIVLLGPDAGNKNLLKIRNSVIFNPAVSGGIETKSPFATNYSPSDTTGQTPSTANPSTTSPATSTPSGNPPTLDSVLANATSDWYKRYFNITSGATGTYSNDFLLKTQMIPPICPTCPNCPNCPSKTTCTNCGGNGGGGTVDANGNPIGTGVGGAIGGAATGVGNAVSGLASGVGTAVSDVGTGVSNVVGGAGVLGGGALLGAGVLGSSAISGVSNVATGAENIVGNAVGGVASLGNNIINTTGGLANKVLNLGDRTINDNRYGYGNGYYGNNYDRGYGYGYDSGRVDGRGTGYSNNTGGYPYGGYGQPPQSNAFYNTSGNKMDPYSYSGALTSKGGDPMPVTTDFSKFGK
jgi:hypothetical protein